MILLVEAATTIPLKRVRNQAADHLISRDYRQSQNRNFREPRFSCVRLAQ
jgi:hypothetical protein